VGKPERIIIDIRPGENGISNVVVEYQPVTSECTPPDQQAAIELGLAALCDKAIGMRLQLGQRVPGALIALHDARTFMEFV
jgi:hypothetical protein